MSVSAFSKECGYGSLLSSDIPLTTSAFENSKRVTSETPCWIFKDG